jgi:hypothetical protein
MKIIKINLIVFEHLVTVFLIFKRSRNSITFDRFVRFWRDFLNTEPSSHSASFLRLSQEIVFFKHFAFVNKGQNQYDYK